MFSSFAEIEAVPLTRLKAPLASAVFSIAANSFAEIALSRSWISRSVWFGSAASLLEQNDEWAVQRRCMSLDTLAPISDAPNASLLVAAD